MSHKVTYAKFHQSIFTPATGHLTDTLPPSSKSISNLSMTWIPGDGLLVQVGTKLAFVPAANVVVLALEGEEKVSKKA